MTDLPDPILRPGLAHWMWLRGLKPSDLEGPLACSYQTIRRICLPFDSAERRMPDDDLLVRIHTLTAGEITLLDFYPPHLRDAARAAMRSAEPTEDQLRRARAH